MATRLQSAGSGVRIPVGLRDFSLLQKNAQTGPGVYPFSCSIGIGVLSRGWSDQGVKLTTYQYSVEFKIEWSCISTQSVCFRTWTGKELAAINSTFAHGTSQISNVSNTSYCIVRTICGMHCSVFLQMIPAAFRNIWHCLSILSLHCHLNMFFASRECSEYHAVDMPVFICFTYTGIRTLM